jgi:stage IV sporulation protein A
MVEGAVGSDEDGAPRMVSTPWFDHEVSMVEAAETGTRKVISEHSNYRHSHLTTDGSITDIPRSAYLPAEERVVDELKKIGKPFIVVLNSANPEGAAAKSLKQELSDKYGVSCMAVNCLSLDEPDVREILKTVLLEFPIAKLGLTSRPVWKLLPPRSHKKAVFSQL